MPTLEALLRSTSAGFVLFASALAPASAQSFNIDFGSAGTQPSSAFGADGQQTGAWNQIGANALNMPLLGLAGNQTAVRIDSSGVNYAFDNGGTAGDTEALLDSLLDGPSTVVVRGLAPGNYDVFTYAWAPDSATALTNVEVLGSTDPLKACGGTWGGTLQEGITHTRHALTIGGQIPNLVIRFTVGAQFASCNGVQIVRASDGGIGRNYCTANTNSTGMAAQISATGSASVGQNHLILSCTNLPQNAAAFFLCSRAQGFGQNPGGSAGNICLGAPIGRGVGGVIANSGPGGALSVQADLSSMPLPNGPVTVISGETWNFQCWYRDFLPGVGATSNLSDAYELRFVAGFVVPTPGMRAIPPGTYFMGSDAPNTPPYYNDAVQNPVRQVTISYPFWMGQYEVTQREYQAVMGENPSYWIGLSRPIENTSWHDARAYCAALTALQAPLIPPGYEYRLPTEAEWEYACRAETTTEFHYGPALYCDAARMYASAHPNTLCSMLETATVGSYLPNAFGLYDMHGNVFEWCLDTASNYSSAAVTDPFVGGVGFGYKVLRGGSWDYGSPRCRSAYREFGEPDVTDRDLGFRVVLAPILVP